MRALFLFAILLTAAGCTSLMRPGASGFEAGPRGIEAYEQDDIACRAEATEPLSYDIRLMGATSYARNRAFNRVYARCMRQQGHRPRSYLKNLLPELGGG